MVSSPGNALKGSVTGISDLGVAVDKDEGDRPNMFGSGKSYGSKVAYTGERSESA